MAYLIYCNNCKAETHHTTATGCARCAARVEDAAKEDFLFFRSNRPLEERIALLESVAYELQNRTKPSWQLNTRIGQ